MIISPLGSNFELILEVDGSNHNSGNVLNYFYNFIESYSECFSSSLQITVTVRYIFEGFLESKPNSEGSWIFDCVGHYFDCAYELNLISQIWNKIHTKFECGLPQPIVQSAIMHNIAFTDFLKTVHIHHQEAFLLGLQGISLCESQEITGQDKQDIRD